jgi:hypothetical protein
VHTKLLLVSRICGIIVVGAISIGLLVVVTAA